MIISSYRLLAIGAFCLPLLASAFNDDQDVQSMAAKGQDPALLDTTPIPGHAKGERVRRAVHPVLLPEAVVMIQTGLSAELVAHSFGLMVTGQLESDPSAYLMRATSAEQMASVLPLLKTSSAVRFAAQNQISLRKRFQFVPNDPYYPKGGGGAAWPGQWYLHNSLGTGVDVRIDDAWAANWTGNGIYIGIVDDGFQKNHQDLSPQYLPAESYDFGQGDPDPSPVYDDDVHGVAVAGIAAARGNNGVGITGTAPLAKLAALRVDFSLGTDAMFADATMYHTSGLVNTIKIKNHSYGFTDPFVPSPLEAAALDVSNSAGSINVYAAGNERGYAGEDANKQQPQASTNAITVAALGSNGKFASYSNFGANVMCTAPSSSTLGAPILTTDRTTKQNGYNGSGDTFPNADYTSVFGGTSASAPIVSGILALAKQANSTLDTRFAKHLIVISSDIVDQADTTTSSDGGWRANQVGRMFNQNYGFGLINATKLTTNARLWSVKPVETRTTGVIPVGVAIPDNDSAGISRTFTVNTQVPVEDVQLHLKFTHPYRGDLMVYVSSARGTTRRLFVRSNSDGGANVDWTFTANQFWGENPNGTWRINVKDVSANDVGTWDSFEVITHHGKLYPRTPYNQCKMVSVSVPTTMTRRGTYTATITTQNLGNTVWTKAAGYSVVSDNPQGNLTWGLNSVPFDAADSIRPGMTKSFTFNVTAPATAGSYVFQWKMAQNGTTFVYNTTPVTIKVN